MKSKFQIYAVKSCNQVKASVKDVDLTKRIVTGFFNTYNYLDSDGEILMLGSAKRTIDTKGVHSNATAKIKHALNHDLTQLPGKLVTLEEKTIGNITGIYFETQMADTTLGNDTLKNYLAGIYDNHSIGFKYVNGVIVNRESHGNSAEAKLWKQIEGSVMNPEQLKDRDSVALIKEINLFEGSTVAFGANSLTPFLGVKDASTTMRQQYQLMWVDKIGKLEQVLKVGTQSDETMRDIEIMLMQLKQVAKEMCMKLNNEKGIVNKIVKNKISKKENQENILYNVAQHL